MKWFKVFLVLSVLIFSPVWVYGQDYTNATLTSTNLYSPPVQIKNQFKITLSGTWTGVVTLEKSKNSVEWINVQTFTSNTTAYYDAGEEGGWYRFRTTSSVTGSVVGSLSMDERKGETGKTVSGPTTFSDAVTFLSTVVIGTTGVNPGRMTAKLAMTNGDTQTAITEAQMLSYYAFSNQGDTVETDAKLTAVSYFIAIQFVVEEALIMEICPPTDEIFDMDGTALDANECIDSPAVSGSKAIFERVQIADGSYRWSFDTVRGVWSRTGATD